MQKYSIFNLVKNAFSNHENWDLAWKDPTPKEEYDVVITGGGGHGLAGRLSAAEGGPSCRAWGGSEPRCGSLERV